MNAAQELIATFLEYYPIDAARLIESVDAERVAELLALLPPRTVATAIQHTLPPVGAAILQALPTQTTARILPAMATPSAVSILRRCPSAWQAAVIGNLDPHAGARLLRALTYPNYSAGQLADAHVLTMTEDRTVSDAIQWIRQSSGELADELYIVDRLHHLVGRVPLQALVIADLDLPLGKIMETALTPLQASWSLDQLMAQPEWDATSVLPVVNGEGTFLGVIRYPQLVKAQRDRHGTEAHRTVSHGKSENS